MNRKTRGNALLYVLIAVALLAALAYAVTNDMGGQQSNRANDERIKILAGDIMNHASAAEQAVFQMTQFGTVYDELLFDKPGDEDFTTDARKQIYNPSGGGLQVFQQNDPTLFDPDSSTNRGWVWQNKTNIAWSPTESGTDLIYSFLDLNPFICAELNEKLIGDASIPDQTGNDLVYADVFTDSATNTDLDETICPDCENKRALCVQNEETYAFYYIIGSR